MILYFHQGDDLPVAAANVVDDDASWWAGTWNLGASLALSAALALGASQAANAQQVFSYHQDDPAGNLRATVDEYFWQDPVQHVLSYSPPQLILDDPVIVPQPAPLGIDEDYWQNPFTPTPATWVYFPAWVFEVMDIVPQPVTVQNYINTGLNNFVSQEIGSGVEF